MSHLYKHPKKTGNYWIAYYYRGDFIRESLKTKDHATAKYLQNKKDELTMGGKAPIPELNSSILKVIDEYNNYCRNHKTNKTYIEDNSATQRFLTWARITAINELTEKKLQDYINERIRIDKISLNTANHIITNIKSLINFAIRRKYLFEDPLKAIKKFKLPQNPPRFLSKNECEKFLKAAEPEDLYPAIATALYTGMRRNELFNLEWKDIDFNRNVVTIRNKEGFTTKSKKFRTIPLHDTLKAILRPYKRDSGLCFDRTNQRRVFKRIVKNAELKNIGWHTLRHSFASALVMQNVDLFTVKELLGHASISTTQVYSHLTQGHIKNAIEKLNF